jgi:SPP1 gp7 family putative phage head morphogenesis protein
MLQRSADLGVNVAIDQFDRIGFGFDWTLANQRAAEWASQYTGQLIADIDRTTQGRLRTAVSEWISNGDPLSKLRGELAPIFGDKRADLIASTEVTRAYSEANRIAYRESGVVDQIEWRTAADELVCPICGPLGGKRDTLDGDFGGAGMPPAHPRCRCWIVPVVELPKAQEKELARQEAAKSADLANEH